FDAPRRIEGVIDAEAVDVGVAGQLDHDLRERTARATEAPQAGVGVLAVHEIDAARTADGDAAENLLQVLLAIGAGDVDWCGMGCCCKCKRRTGERKGESDHYRVGLSALRAAKSAAPHPQRSKACAMLHEFGIMSSAGAQTRAK